MARQRLLEDGGGGFSIFRLPSDSQGKASWNVGHEHGESGRRKRLPDGMCEIAKRTENEIQLARPGQDFDVKGVALCSERCRKRVQRAVGPWKGICGS